MNWSSLKGKNRKLSGLYLIDLKGDPIRSIVVILVKIFKTEKTIEIHLVRLTDVCGKVLSEKYAYKSVKTALLLSNVIDADHQDGCLFTNNLKAIFHYHMGFNWCSS